jgi:hypothetical protein
VGTCFFAKVQTDPGAYQAPSTKDTASFPGLKRLGRDTDHTISSAKVTNDKSCIATLTSGVLWPVIGRTEKIDFLNTSPKSYQT